MTVRTFISWPRLVIALVLMGALLSAAALVAVDQTRRVLKDVFGNEAAIKTVEEATSVNAWRLPEHSFHQESPGKYKYSAGPVEVPKEAAAKLQKILLDKASFVERNKNCEPDYGVRVQLAKEKDTVDVFFCFGCDILAIYHNGESVGDEDFDDARAKILEVIKPLFKDDTAIQGLK